MTLLESPDPEKGRILLQIARSAIAHALKIKDVNDDAIDKTARWLAEPGATFITLTRNGQLRGCIGSLLAHQSVFEDVSSNAVSAALRDSRFQPVTAAEWNQIRIEVSLLSALQPITFDSEADALAQLRPGIDGVMLEYGIYRSTFLPQVWDSLPEPQDFMAQLKMKAGLEPDFWDDAIHLSRYTVQKWRESDFVEGEYHG